MIIERVEKVIKDSLSAEGYNIVRIKYEGLNRKTLQIMIERNDDKPVSIDDCKKVNDIVTTLFIVEDPIEDEYNLEISSPGIDRPLVKKEDFVKFKDQPIRLKTKHKVNDSYKIRGVLSGMKEDVVILTAEDGSKIEVDFDNINDAQLDIERNLFGKTKK